MSNETEAPLVPVVTIKIPMAVKGDATWVTLAVPFLKRRA